MESLEPERKRLRQQLRRCAHACGVDRCRDDAGRQKVKEMVEAIRAADGPAESQEEAEQAYASYEATYAAAPPQEAAADAGAGAAAGQEGVQAGGGFRLRGKSFLFTYNWKFLSRPRPDGTPPAQSEEALWNEWKAWKKARKKALGIRQSSSTLERSVKSRHKGRVHFHWKVNLATALDQATTEGFEFCGVKPDARATVVAKAADGQKKPRGANFLEASNRGHFYTVAPKVGTLYSDSNWKAWTNYRVLGKWLDDLWTDGKLDHDTYGTLALRVRVGYANRKKDLEMVKAAEHDARVDRELAEVGKELDLLKAPFLPFPEVTAWEDTFLTLRFRWQLLALVADSASGKSSYAESLFDNPFVLTVEEAEHLDLKAFDRDTHDGIVLDNVNTWQQLLRWRALLQARNAKTYGGQSATNMYAYAQYLFGVAIAVTVDLDAPDGHLVDPEHPNRSKWLCKNCVFVRLERGGTFYDATTLPATKLENTHSLFAQTLKRRRTQA